MLLLVTGSGEFCLWTVDAVIILILNLSRNRSVGKDLYKWNKVSTRAQLLGQGRKKVNVFKKVVAPSFKKKGGKKRGLQCATKMERQGRTFVMILKFEIDLRNIGILFHFGVPPHLLLGQLKKIL